MLNLVPASALYYVLVAGAYQTLPCSLVGRAHPGAHDPGLGGHHALPGGEFSNGNSLVRLRISYSVATILPGLYSFYMLGLAKVMPYEFTPIVLLALGGLMLSSRRPRWTGNEGRGLHRIDC